MTAAAVAARGHPPRAPALARAGLRLCARASCYPAANPTARGSPRVSCFPATKVPNFQDVHAWDEYTCFTCVCGIPEMYAMCETSVDSFFVVENSHEALVAHVRHVFRTSLERFDAHVRVLV